jgi:transcriptional regulator with XRE-family HTH domain
LTREQISNELNITGNTVARWERDEMKIPPFLHLAMETVTRNLLNKKN